MEQVEQKLRLLINSLVRCPWAAYFFVVSIHVSVMHLTKENISLSEVSQIKRGGHWEQTEWRGNGSSRERVRLRSGPYSSSYLQGSESLEQRIAVLWISLWPSTSLGRGSSHLCCCGCGTLQTILLLPHLLQEFILKQRGGEIRDECLEVTKKWRISSSYHSGIQINRKKKFDDQLRIPVLLK